MKLKKKKIISYFVYLFLCLFPLYSNIVEKLLNDGANFVRILDNLSTGHKKNISDLLEKYDNLDS